MDWFLAFLAKLIAAFLAAIVSDKRVQTTEEVVKGIEDAQRENDVKFRDLDTAIKRLRNIQAAGVDGKRPDNPK